LTLVLDASLALSWVLPGEETERTDRLHARVKADGAVASHVWRLEVTNILLQSERTKRIGPAETGRLMAIMEALPVAIDTTGLDQVFGRTVELARAHGLTTYDASYLELAIRSGLPLASNDTPLRDAAREIGVEVL
jgi:predicted nucleic acid-binding protein